MTNEQRLALISHAQEWIKEKEQCRDEIPFGLSDESEMELKLIKIALASLQAEPVAWIVMAPQGDYIERNPDFVAHLEGCGIAKCKALIAAPTT